MRENKEEVRQSLVRFSEAARWYADCVMDLSPNFMSIRLGLLAKMSPLPALSDELHRLEARLKINSPEHVVDTLRQIADVADRCADARKPDPDP